MRFRSLDSVRGLAALMVLLNHVYNEMQFPWSSPALTYSPIGNAINGRLAVMVFFVLSGFVLSSSLASSRTIFSYRLFVAKRLTRIYLPFAGALAIAAIIASCIAFPIAPWRIGEDWVNPIQDVLLQHILMTGWGYRNISLLPPMWTLIQEVRIGLLFPLIYWLVKRYGISAVIVSIAAAMVSAKIPSVFGEKYDDKVPSGYVGTVFITVYYAMFFFIGSYLFIYRDRCVRAAGKVRPDLLIAITIVWLLIPRVLTDKSFLVGDLYFAASAILIIVLPLALPAVDRFLNHKVLLWLGKISFSLYLTHMIVLLSCDILLGAFLPVPVAIAIGGLLSFPVASLFYALIERPAHQLSGWIGRFTADGAVKEASASTTTP